MCGLGLQHYRWPWRSGWERLCVDLARVQAAAGRWKPVFTREFYEWASGWAGGLQWAVGDQKVNATDSLYVYSTIQEVPLTTIRVFAPCVKGTGWRDSTLYKNLSGMVGDTNIPSWNNSFCLSILIQKCACCGIHAALLMDVCIYEGGVGKGEQW